MATSFSQKQADNISAARATAGVYFSGLGLVLTLLAFTFTGTAQAIYFSEYIEGSGNNKVLEIYNESPAALNLGTNSVQVRLFANGSQTVTATIDLSGTIAFGDVFVLAHPSAAQGILFWADQLSTSLTFNGDDAIDLYAAGGTLDLIGQVGFDPGTEWGSGLTSTQDNTLRRKVEFTSGNPGGGAFSPAVEWVGFLNDTTDGLGSHAGATVFPPGDFDHSGTVESADYVVWRKSNNLAADYNLWRAHFGEGPFGGLATEHTPTPELSSITLLAIGSAGFFTRRRKPVPHNRV